MLEEDVFLSKIKELITIDRSNLDFVPTRKNRESRRKYGITIEEIEDSILSLTPKDLYSGPEKDRDKPGEYLYVFKKNLNCKMFYIKLKLRNDQIVVCLSFHEDEI